MGRTAAAYGALLLGREFSGTLILAHGYNGSPQVGVYQTISETAPSQLNLLTQIPDLPLSDKEYAPSSDKIMNPEAASSKLAALIADARRPVVLAGHSLGVNIALFTLSHYQVEVEAALLISGRFKTPSGDENLERWCYRRQLLPGEIKRKIAGPFIAVHSDDDTVVTPPRLNLANIASTFGAEPVITHGYGHFDKPEHAPFLIGVIRSKIIPSIRG